MTRGSHSQAPFFPFDIMRRGRAGGIRMVEIVDYIPLVKKWDETYLHKALFLDLYDYSSIHKVVCVCLIRSLCINIYCLARPFLKLVFC